MNIPHPGEILSEYLFNMEVSQLSKKIGIDESELLDILNCKSSISSEMSISLSKHLNTNPDFWVKLQEQYDLHIAPQ